jgi:hypothetical protein
MFSLQQPRVAPAKPVLTTPEGVESHRFTLRDDNGQHYHRAVRVAESPYYVALAWRANRRSPVHELGTFRLDLPALLDAGYIRLDRPGAEHEVRVRFFRAEDGWIYLQPRLDAPALRIAQAPI